MLARFRRPVVNDRGTVLPFATALFTNRIDNVAPTLWSDRDASTVLSTVGAATATINGYLDVFLMPAEYTLALTSADGSFTGSEEVLIAPRYAIIDDSSVARTLTAIDAGNIIDFTNGSAIQVDLQTDAEFFFPTGTVIHMRQSGAGQITLVAPTGGTLQAPGDGTLVTAAQGSTIAILKKSANNWKVIGHTVAA